MVLATSAAARRRGRHRGGWPALKRRSAALAAVLLAGGLAMVGAGAAVAPGRAAAADIPWTCDASGYLFRSPNGPGTQPHLMDRVTIPTGASSSLGTTVDGVNAAGFRLQDNFIYGFDTTTGQLVRVNADLSLTELGVPAGFPSTTMTAGDFDGSGNLWQLGTTTSPASWVETNVSATPPAVVAQGTVTAPAGLQFPEDWSFIGGAFYGVSPTSTGTGDAHLVRFNTGTGTFTDLGPLTGVPSSSDYGATYSDANGFLYATNDATGDIYRIDPGTQAAILVSRGPSGANSDGARCRLAGTPTITVTKQVGGRLQPDDQFTVALKNSSGTTLTSATTTGTETTVSTADWPAVVGSTYTITDALAPGSPTPSSGYASSIECLDSSGNPVPVGGSPGSWTFQVPGAEPFSCTVSDDPTPQAQISLDKEASPFDPASFVPGDLITYSYLVTNTGNVPLTDVTVTEVAFSGTGAPSPINCPPGPISLAPGEQVRCASTYVLTQADVDAGSLTDTARATATSPGTGGNLVSAEDTVVLPSNQAPALTLTKSAEPSTVTAVGQTISYTFVVTNSGNVTMNNVDVVETGFSGTGTPPAITCPTGPLAAGAKVTCVATYTVTQADMDAGQITNTATATGTAPDGSTVTSPPADATVTTTTTPGLVAVKTATPGTVTAAGESVLYDVTVFNNGNVTVTNVRVDEQSFSGSGPRDPFVCAPTTLAPGETAHCTSAYTVTQADIDAGSIMDTATATGDLPPGAGGGSVTSPPTSAIVGVEAAEPTLSLKKIAEPPAVSAAGQEVTYLFVVTNTGGLTVNNLTVADTSFTGTGAPPVIDCPVTTLQPGEETTCKGVYTVTQADIDAGTDIVDTALATATDPNGLTVTSPEADASVSVADAAPSLEMVKSAHPTVVTTPGEVVTYEYLVTNNGTVTISGVRIAELSFSGSPVPVATCPVTVLAPGDQTTCTATYTVTAADIAAGGISDTAVAEGDDPAGDLVTSPPSSVDVNVAAAPSLKAEKFVSPSIVHAAGEQVDYKVVVTNTGGLPLSDINVLDFGFTGTGPVPVINCPSPTLQPGEQDSCSGTYIVTQEDIDRGGPIFNTAAAHGRAPDGSDVVSEPSDAVLDVAPIRSLDLVKSVHPPSVTAAGQTVTYEFLLINNGTVTVVDPVIHELFFSGTGPLPPVSCPGVLPPGAAVFCAVPYTLTQADIDSGSVLNTAVATATDPSGNPIASPESSAVLDVAATPTLSLTKVATPPTVTAAGDVVNFQYVVHNTGDLTVSDVNVVETTFTGTGPAPVVSCPPATLAPGGEVTCTGSYTVTQADIDSGNAIKDIAIASGTGPAGQPAISNDASAAVDVAPVRSLALVKSVNPTEVSTAGQTVTYTFLVVNNGTTSVTNVDITELSFSGSPVPAVTCPAVTLAPGDSTTCTASYTVTQADIDAGGITDTAVATGTDPAGNPIDSPPSSADVGTTVESGLSLTKIAVPAGVSAAGQVVDYDIIVTNSGGLTITGLAVTDVAFSGTGTPPLITCPATALAPGAQATCTASYTVTQADIDAGTPITNTAVATGTDSTGATVTSNDASATVAIEATPSLAMVKSVNPPAATAAGETVTYSFLTTNNGNTTVTDLAIAEQSFSGTGTLSPVVCPVTVLSPGGSTTCTATYTVTQADIDAGGVTNTAIATGTGPDGTVIDSPPSSSFLGTPAAAELLLTKVAVPASVSAAGQTVTFQYQVTNIGNLTITGLTVADVVFTGAGTPPTVTCPPQALAPGGEATCTGTYTVTQADMDAVTGITDTAVATGTDASGLAAVSNEATATVDIAAASSLSLVKSVSPDTVTTAGQRVTYEFLITNTGNVTVTDPAIVEQSFSGTGTLSPVVCPVTVLPPGGSTRCTATYTLTQADVDAGGVSNVATATATPPPGVTPPESAPSGATVESTATSSLTIVKSGRVLDLNGDRRADVGDRIEWTVVVTNTGGTTLHGITVSDPTAGPVACPVTELPPGASMTCTLPPHTITAADAAAGQVTNSATATGLTPGNEPVSAGPATATIPVVSSELPVTGFDLWRPFAVAAVLLTVGGGLLLIGLRVIRSQR